MAYGLDFNRMAPAYQRRPMMGGQNPSQYDQGVVRFPAMGSPGRAATYPGKPGGVDGGIIYEPVRPWHQQPAYSPRGGMSARGSRLRPAYDYMPPNAF